MVAAEVVLRENNGFIDVLVLKLDYSDIAKGKSYKIDLKIL